MWWNTFYNVGTGGGETIYISNDEIRGSLEKRYIMSGDLETEDDLIGSLEQELYVKGEVQTDEIEGILEDNESITGTIECEN